MLTLKTHLKKVTKMPEDKFLEMYSSGMSDRAIAHAFGIGHNTVYRRRKKLGLVANSHQKKTSAELIDKYKEDNRKIYEAFKRNPNAKDYKRKKSKEAAKLSRYKKKRSVYMSDYLQRDYVKEKTKAYLSKQEVKDMRRKAYSKFWSNPANREKDKIRKFNERWSDIEAREIGKCNQIISGLIYAPEMNQPREVV